MSKKRKFALETRALEPVPAVERQHWMSVTLIQAGFMISATSLWTGSLMVAGMSLWETVIAASVGYAVIVVICTIQGIMGSDLGAPSIVAATSSFGDRGSQWIISSICAVCTIGWFAINANICGAAFSGLMKTSFGIYIPVQVSVIIWGIVMFTTAAIGFDGLKIINIIAVPLMLAVSVVGVYMALSGSVEPVKSFTKSASMSFIKGTDMVIGGFIVGAVLSADYTRYQKTRSDVLKSSFFGIFPIGVGLLWAGAILAVAAGTEDLTEIFIGLGIPFLGMISLILSTWPANAANAYSAGLDTMKVFNIKDKYRPAVTIVCGVLGTAVGSFQIIHHFETFLIYLGIVIAPFEGVIIADYWVIGKAKAANWAPVKNINWAGMIAPVSGVAASVWIKVGIASINGIIISFICYVILYKVLPKPEKIPFNKC